MVVSEDPVDVAAPHAVIIVVGSPPRQQQGVPVDDINQEVCLAVASLNLHAFFLSVIASATSFSSTNCRAIASYVSILNK